MLRGYADKWALITGASSGIGAEFARRLAARGMHLVLTARRKELLENLATELHTAHGTKCEIILMDLEIPEQGKELHAEIARRNIRIDLLINNAGFGHVAQILETEPHRIHEMLMLNVVALSDLTYLYLPEMMRRGEGGIVNVSSVAGFQPVAYMSAYAASKAFVLHFSEALWAEAYDYGVTVRRSARERHGPTSSTWRGPRLAERTGTNRSGSGQNQPQSPGAAETVRRVGMGKLLPHPARADRQPPDSRPGIHADVPPDQTDRTRRKRPQTIDHCRTSIRDLNRCNSADFSNFSLRHIRESEHVQAKIVLLQENGIGPEIMAEGESILKRSPAVLDINSAFKAFTWGNAIDSHGTPSLTDFGRLQSLRCRAARGRRWPEMG
ncbi:MAG: SDR family NAD(P)-dependent oxidoreductase [Planctomycetales bacterium]